MADMSDDHDVMRQLIAHQPRLRARIRAVVGDPHLTEDILQEIAVVVMTQRDRFEPGTSFQAWVNEIQRRTTLGLCRHRGRAPLPCSPDLLDAIEHEVREPSRWDRQREALGHCLQALPEEGRRLLLWRYGEDLSSEDLSARAGRSVDGVKSLLKRMRALLGSCIDRRLAAEGG
ncbi:MAG: hypothetical protein RLZZ127_1350 [Planctomycetota bacterium]|jgi:RNA polymerase sigma-70 factor (ECF subfamily)